MNKKHTNYYLDIANALAPTVSTRTAVQSLKEQLREVTAKNIVLDFSNVESISRSAAHEFITTQFDLTNCNQKWIEFVHLQPSVSAVFRTVTDNAINTRKKDRIISNERVSFSALKTLSF